MRYGFVIDQRKCIGCHACTVACKEENQVPLGVNRTWVKYIEKGTYPHTRRYFSVLRCNHCDSAPCVAICPTVALYRRRDGIVDFNRERCIGCKSCLQACPYDALYIDPETLTAAKCHYCAHRIEVGLEPACAVVCPVQAIVAGDLDDPGSSIARLVASQQVQVRKPEQGTAPKVFYLGADEAALTPGMQTHAGQYVFAQRASIPVPGQPGRPATPDETIDTAAGPGHHGLARTVYDVAHPERPWGGKVAAYLWTKSVAAGALLVAGAGLLTGAASGNVLAGLLAPSLAILFVLLTTALLIGDLKRPERFWLLLLQPNPRSWLVWGGWILIAFGGVAALWLLLGLTGQSQALRLLSVPAMALAAAAAGYSAFLFGQAAGRDFWQSPLLLPHLLVAALAAGSAGLLLASAPLGLTTAAPRGLRLVLLAALASGAVVLMAELVGLHATQDARRAAHALSRGALSLRFWAGAMGAGTLLPMALLVTPWPPAWMLAACLALAGLWLYEDLWMRAGQSVPLS